LDYEPEWEDAVGEESAERRPGDEPLSDLNSGEQQDLNSSQTERGMEQRLPSEAPLLGPQVPTNENDG
jgi:hypothetical protein